MNRCDSYAGFNTTYAGAPEGQASPVRYLFNMQSIRKKDIRS